MSFAELPTGKVYLRSLVNKTIIIKTRNPDLFMAGIFFVWREKRTKVFAADKTITNIFRAECVTMHTCASTAKPAF